jgi:hypothetical protein
MQGSQLPQDASTEIVYRQRCGKSAKQFSRWKGDAVYLHQGSQQVRIVPP